MGNIAAEPSFDEIASSPVKPDTRKEKVEQTKLRGKLHRRRKWCND